MRRAFQLSSGTKLFTKPMAILQHLDDTEWLAQIEAVDRFTANMIAYPGRTFGQLYHRMLKANQLLTGKVNLSGHEIDVADIKAPVLVFGGNTDGIAPINAVKALVAAADRAPTRSASRSCRAATSACSPAAPRGSTTWVTMDEWIEQYSTPDDRPGARPRKTAGKAARQDGDEDGRRGSPSRRCKRHGRGRPAARRRP